MSDAEALLDGLRTVVLAVDTDGVVRDARGAVAALLGAAHADAVGSALSAVFAEDDASRVAAAIAAESHAGSEDDDTGGAGEGTPGDRPAAAEATPDAALRGLRLAGGEGVTPTLVDVFIGHPVHGGPQGRRVVELVPARPATDVEPRWVELLDDAPLPSLLATALADLSAAGAGAGGRQWTVVLGPRSDDDLLSRVDRAGEVLLADPSTPHDVLAAVAAVVGTGVVPPWRAGGAESRRAVALDDLPLVVAAAARAHGVSSATLAVAEVAGRGQLGLLTLFDDRRWAAVGDRWQRRADRVVRLLAAAVARRHDADGLDRSSTHDGLTGLVSRQRFLATVEEYPGDVAVLAVDVDGFGALNAEHGQSCGDRVLVEIGRRLRAACRTGDLVARLGADEFGVALPDASADDAVVVGRRVLEAVARPLPEGLGADSVTVSIGLVRSGAGRRGRRDALERAERAQGHARRSGGGRLAVAAEGGTDGADRTVDRARDTEPADRAERAGSAGPTAATADIAGHGITGGSGRRRP